MNQEELQHEMDLMVAGRINIVFSFMLLLFFYFLSPFLCGNILLSDVVIVSAYAAYIA